MTQFEVIEHKDGIKKNEHIIYCINYVDPTFAVASIDRKLEKGSLVLLDGNNVILDNKVVGNVIKRKSSSEVKVSTDYDIKYTGGYSLDGKTIYLDEHFPRILHVEGKEVDAVKSIGLHHELPEKWLSDEKYEYPYAHEIATGIEKQYVESLGVTWKGYCDEVDKNLRQVYKRELGKSPSALDLAPYLYCRDQEALKEIRKSEEI
ncbi:MAG: hypothetical protein LVQ96_04695 [Thermoplasmatales archaeon]|nr:hypothetical protein [Thermoplasmatales archaeon]MCW6170453.1 hypothetical protein [Thermoplasmatales archaeon]